jgi:hypothetical protein
MTLAVTQHHGSPKVGSNLGRKTNRTCFSRSSVRHRCSTPSSAHFAPERAALNERFSSRIWLQETLFRAVTLLAVLELFQKN